MGISGSRLEGAKPTETHGKDEHGSQYDPHFTDNVISATGRNANPRLSQIMPALLRHMHDFAREVDLTTAEWMAGVEMINEAGRMSTDKRNETQLICDILGLESLVDEISSKILSRSSSSSSSSSGGGGGGGGSTAAAGVAAAATPSTVLGPFHRADAPMLANGSSIISPAARGTTWYGSAEPRLARLTGRVLSASTGRALAGAAVEVWLAGPNGLYEQQDPGQPDMNLRGRFRTDGAGRYDVYALRPAAYPIPLDGPAGRLLALLDRPPYRPAHVHFIVAAAGHATLVTQLFDREDGHARRDAVFAVKEELLVSFEERAGDDRARWQLTYDFLLREV